MKNTPYRIAAIFIAFLLTYALPSYAGNASTYKVTVESIQLKNSSGSWVTIATPNQELDIASVSASSTVGSMFSSAKIPVGDYVNFKIVLSETMKFSGSDGAHYTKSGGSVTITGDGTCGSTINWLADPPVGQATPNDTAAETHTAIASQMGESTAYLNLDPADGDSYIEIYGRTDLSTPVSVKANSDISMYFEFDTQGTVHYVDAGVPNGSDLMFFTPPQEGTKFGITVDGSSITVTKDSMRIDF